MNEKSKTKIWLNILLDESSSMGHLTSQTIEEFNGFIDEQKKVKNAQILGTLTTFANKPRHLYIARPIDQVPELSEESYHPCGGTALFDAINASMQTVENSMRREDEKTEVLFVIITDGEENSSREFPAHNDGLNRIRSMISKRKEEGWNFVFLGADLDKWHGQNLGIKSSIRVNKGNTKQMYKALARSTSLYAASVDRGEVVEDVLSLNSADYDGIGESE